VIRLLLSDLTAHARVWLGVLALTVTTGFVGAIAAGLIETGSVHGGRVQDGLSSTSAAVIMFTSVTAIIVLIGIVVLTQLGIVGAVGAAVGCLVAVPVFPALFVWAFREWSNMQGISLHLGIISMLIVVAAITVVVMIGGLRGARRASRTQPIEALRDPEPPIVTALTVGGAVAVAGNLDGSATLSGFSGHAILLTPLLAAALAAAGPRVFPLVLRAWTSLVPSHMSASWFLARNSARYRLSQSNAAISPLMVAIALAGGLYTLAATLDAALLARGGSTTSTGLALEGVVILLGGPLLLSAVAAAATVFMSGRARQREFALIQAAGSTQSVISLAAIWEAVIYTMTATILGTIATVAGGLIIASELSLALPVVSFSTIGLIAAGGLVLILIATIAPTVAALRHEIPRTLAVE
jgi:putative ABC transport system permease protein